MPGDGGTYRRPVTVTLTATDAAPGSGVDKTEYRVNGGDWNDYSAPIRREQPGMYVVEFRSTDRTGNVEATKSIAFKIAVAGELPAELQRRVHGHRRSIRSGRFCARTPRHGRSWTARCG